MAFKPLFNNVLIKRVEEDNKTAAGIIIPDNAKEKPSRAKVIAVGAGLTDMNGKNIPVAVKEGDTVLFGKWSGTEVKIDGEDLLIIKDAEILGTIE